MASDNDITVRKRRCKDVFDGDLAHFIPGSSDDAQTYNKKALEWAIKWPDETGDGKVDALDYSSKKWAVYTDGPVDPDNNLFSSKWYAQYAEMQANISITWANKSLEWAESDNVIEGTDSSYSSKHWSGVSKGWADDSLSYSVAADNSRQLAFEWAEKMNGPVTGDQYSAKYWAAKAEERSGGSEEWSIVSHDWANGGLEKGALQPLDNDNYSSLYWAYSASQSASQADQYQLAAYNYQEEAKRQKQDAVVARSGAETAQRKAEEAQNLAEVAQGKAETALEAAETAQGNAENAQTATEDAQAAAEAALTAAETAQTKSEQARTAALAAQTAAETAQGKAENAQTAAETALTASELALTKAETAQTASEVAQGKAEDAQAAAEAALTAAETAQGITETARDRAQEWAESDLEITVPGDTDTHYSAKKHAQDALDTFGLTANVYTLTVGVYNDTTVATAAAYGHADDAMRANESALEAKDDAIEAQGFAESALTAAEDARDLALEWADNDYGVPVTGTDSYSSKHWSTEALNKVASLGNVAMRDAANTFTQDNQFDGDVAIGQPGTPGDKAKCQLNRTSGSYNASGALIDNLGRAMLITYNGAGNKTNFITYMNNHSSDLDITASAADGNYIYLEAKVPGTYANEIEYYATGSFYNNTHGSTTQGTKTAGTDEVKAQCQVSLTSNLAQAGSIVYTKGGVVKGIAVAPAINGSRTLLELADLINEKEDLDFTASVEGTYLVLTNKEFGADSTVYYRNGCFNANAHLKVKQGTVTPGTEDIPSSGNKLTLNGESVPTHFGNNEYTGINIFTGPVGILSTGSFTNNGVTVLNGDTVIAGGIVENNRVLSEFIRSQLHFHPYYGDCKTMDDTLSVDPFIAWRPLVVFDLNNDRAISDGNIGSSGKSVLGNFGNIDRVLCTYQPGGILNYPFAHVYAKAIFINFTSSPSFYEMWINVTYGLKAIFVKCDVGPSTLGGNFYKKLQGFGNSVEELFMDFPVCLNWGTNDFGLNTIRSTIKKLTMLTTDKCRSLNNIRGYDSQNLDFTLLTLVKINNVSNVISADNAFLGFVAVPSSHFPLLWPSLSTGKDMFTRCSLLTSTDANAILNSLPDWSTEDPPASHVITFTGTKAATEWAASGADLSHIEAAEAKGWTVEGRPAVTE